MTAIIFSFVKKKNFFPLFLLFFFGIKNAWKLFCLWRNVLTSVNIFRREGKKKNVFCFVLYLSIFFSSPLPSPFHLIYLWKYVWMKRKFFLKNWFFLWNLLTHLRRHFPVLELNNISQTRGKKKTVYITHLQYEENNLIRKTTKLKIKKPTTHEVSNLERASVTVVNLTRADRLSFIFFYALLFFF